MCVCSVDISTSHVLTSVQMKSCTVCLRGFHVTPLQEISLSSSGLTCFMHVYAYFYKYMHADARGKQLELVKFDLCLCM
jgi:hypothetical protein